MLTRSVFERLRYEVSGLVRRPFLAAHERKAKAYLEAEGVLALLRQGDASEIKAVFGDLAYLHRTVRRIRPTTVVEFGVGMSTLVFAHALHKNRTERPGATEGRLYTVDTSDYWLDNTRNKLPEDLRGLVNLTHTEAHLTTVNDELCHCYETLPNVVPDLIYVDGPDPATVKGEIRGLTYEVARGEPRRAMSADVLMYESGLKIGSMIVVDNRKMNTRFLRRNLKRKWQFRANKAEGRFTFVLVD